MTDALNKIWNFLERCWLDALLSLPVAAVVASVLIKDAHWLWLPDGTGTNETAWTGEATRSVVLTLGALGAQVRNLAPAIGWDALLGDKQPLWWL